MLPIKKADSEKQRQFIELVDKILTINENDYLVNGTKHAKVQEYEKEIDQLVYRLYNIEPDEIRLVEESIAWKASCQFCRYAACSGRFSRRSRVCSHILTF